MRFAYLSLGLKVKPGTKLQLKKELMVKLELELDLKLELKVIQEIMHLGLWTSQAQTGPFP